MSGSLIHLHGARERAHGVRLVIELRIVHPQAKRHGAARRIALHGVLRASERMERPRRKPGVHARRASPVRARAMSLTRPRGDPRTPPTCRPWHLRGAARRPRRIGHATLSRVLFSHLCGGDPRAGASCGKESLRTWSSIRVSFAIVGDDSGDDGAAFQARLGLGGLAARHYFASPNARMRIIRIPDPARRANRMHGSLLVV